MNWFCFYLFFWLIIYYIPSNTILPFPHEKVIICNYFSISNDSTSDKVGLFLLQPLIKPWPTEGIPYPYNCWKTSVTNWQSEKNAEVGTPWFDQCWHLLHFFFFFSFKKLLFPWLCAYCWWKVILYDNWKCNFLWLSPLSSTLSNPNLHPRLQKILNIWWCCNGVIHYSHLQSSQTINSRIILKQCLKSCKHFGQQ